MIRKALIPIAGKASRLMPVASVVPKAIFPLVDGRDNIRSVLHIILEQAKCARIEHIGIVAAPWQTEILQQYFNAVLEGGFGELPANIEYIIQSSPKGFGDAVLRGADFIGDESFMLLLGDHVCIEARQKPACVAQTARAFDSIGGVAMVGVQPVSTQELSKVGVASGVQIQHDIYRCTGFVEKPEPRTAQQKLVTAGLPRGTFLAHCGIYIFTTEIFDCLSHVSMAAQKLRKEVELAEAQAMLLKKYPEKYFLYKIAGRTHDIGTPAGYAAAQTALRSKEKRL